GTPAISSQRSFSGRDSSHDRNVAIDIRSVVAPAIFLSAALHRSVSVASGKGTLVPTRLKRNLIVQIATLAAASGHCGLARGRARGAEVARVVVAELAAAAASAARTVEHGERRVEALQHHLGRILLDPLLIGPLARLQLAFEVNLRAFLEILLGDLGETLVEDHHAVPLGLFLAFAGRLVAPAFRGRDT